VLPGCGPWKAITDVVSPAEGAEPGYREQGVRERVR
jgi:hypothetical protein